jgi:hypothetical protein
MQAVLLHQVLQVDVGLRGSHGQGGGALADAIDGAWCSPEGKHLKIAGRKITTPGGALLDGDYSRHAFSWVAPASEPGGGDTIYMQLMNETTALVRQGTPVAQPITWKRCEATS